MGATHTVLWDFYDTGETDIKYFDTYDEADAFMSAMGFTDPRMFTDDPEENDTGVYVEHIPSFDAREKDPSWDMFLKSIGL